MCGQNLRWAIIKHLPSSWLAAKMVDVTTTTKLLIRAYYIIYLLNLDEQFIFNKFVRVLNLVLLSILIVLLFLH